MKGSSQHCNASLCGGRHAGYLAARNARDSKELALARRGGGPVCM